MTNNRLEPQFTPDCTKGEVLFGLFWLVLHMFAFPLLVAQMQLVWFPALTDIQANALYYGVSLTVVLLFGMKLLRREFDHLLDRPFLCIRCFFSAYLLWYALNLLTAGLMTLLGTEAMPPNDAAVDTLAAANFNVTLVISVIAAPILEEVLFRGILFQSIRRHSRILAYTASLAVFGIYHTWQFALLYQDPMYLLYSLLYIPITLAITWSYEASGSLWTAIFLHASNNYIAMQLTQML